MCNSLYTNGSARPWSSIQLKFTAQCEGLRGFQRHATSLRLVSQLLRVGYVNITVSQWPADVCSLEFAAFSCCPFPDERLSVKADYSSEKQRLVVRFQVHHTYQYQNTTFLGGEQQSLHGLSGLRAGRLIHTIHGLASPVIPTLNLLAGMAYSMQSWCGGQ